MDLDRPPFWERAGVAGRIELKLGPAIDTLRALPDEPVIDIAFIDADKASYRAYYEEIVRRLRPGGLPLERAGQAARTDEPNTRRPAGRAIAAGVGDPWGRRTVSLDRRRVSLHNP